MDGDYYGTFWEGRQYWLTLALPSAIWLFSLILIIVANNRGAYQTKWLIRLYFFLTFFMFIGANGFRYIAVELIRANLYTLSDSISIMLENGHYALLALAFIIAFYNRRRASLWLIIAALTLLPAIRYSVWFVNLVIWYAQGYLS